MTGVAPGRCGPCRQVGRGFRLARAAGPYEGSLKETVLQFKYGGRHRLSSPLAQLAFERCIDSGELPLPAAVVPVPLHPRRRRERGYNQAELLALGVSASARIPMERALIKIWDRPPQAELAAHARRRSAAGAYQAQVPPFLRGKDLLLVDDVFTTGATVNACVSALLKSGVGAVDVLTLARVR